MSVATTPTLWWNVRVDDSIPYWATSLAIDAEGNAHIGYQDYRDAKVKYACEKGGNWTVENVDSTGHTGEFASLALDAKGNPHIAYGKAYRNSHDFDLKYASKNGNGSWTVETADGRSRCCAGWKTVEVGWWASLALDARGNPHIAYYDKSLIREGEEANNLKYANKSGSNWTCETVDSTGDVGKHTSLALDAKGDPHIAYSDNTKHTNRLLKYASKKGGNWTAEIVPTPPGSMGIMGCSLAVDAEGNPHIAYYEMTIWMKKGNLKYASKSGGSWTVETVESDAGEQPSLALDAEGNPHIAYHDHPNGCLKYASKKGGNWTVETVDCTALVVGYFASLALDAYGNPRIAYYDLTNDYVKYASAAVELNSPGTDWKVGTSRTVTWQGRGSVDLFISSDGGTTWIPLASGLTGGSYDLQVPNLPTTSAKLKLERSMLHSVTITSGFLTIAP